MIWIAATILCFILFAGAAIPLKWVFKHYQAVLGAVCAYVIAAVLSLGLIFIYGDTLFSASGIVAMAAAEEIARGTMLYFFVLRRSNLLAQRALFGTIFGWIEFLVRFYPDMSTCDAKLSPLTCAEGIPYLGIAWAEVILFHIFISMVNYRDATTPRNLIIAIFSGALIHAALNAAKILPAWGQDNLSVFFIIPCLYVSLYAVVFVLSIDRSGYFSRSSKKC